MQVIICDDEISTCAEMEQILREFAFKNSIKLETEVFYDGNTLKQYLIRETVPAILFLDIELPGANGVEIGKYIREELRNSEMFLVYISSKKEYALELFQNQPFDFLVKPIKKEKLWHVMEKMFHIIGKNECNFTYKNQGNTYRIMYKDILYFQSDGRKINIVKENEIQSFYGKLSEVEKECPEGLFLRIHKSCLINLHYAKKINYREIKMVNGDVLDISRSNRVEVRRKLMESMTNGIRNNS